MIILPQDQLMQGEVHYVPSTFNSAIPKHANTITPGFLATAFTEWCVKYLDDVLPPPESGISRHGSKAKKYGTWFRVTAKENQIALQTQFEQLADGYFEKLTKAKEKLRSEGAGSNCVGSVEPAFNPPPPAKVDWDQFKIKVGIILSRTLTSRLLDVCYIGAT